MGKPHPHNALTDRKARQVQEPGRYADGQGLYLLVEESGARRWLLRTSVHGRRVDMGLGGFPLVGLAEARERALHYRKIARGGGDPLAEKRKAQAPVPTFAEAAQAVYAEHVKGWKNRKHQAQWINTLLSASTLPYADIPEFIRKLQTSGLGEATKLAFELLVLTAAVSDIGKKGGGAREGGRCLKQALTIIRYRRGRDSGEGFVYRGVPALDRPRSPALGGWGFFAVLTSA